MKTQHKIKQENFLEQAVKKLKEHDFKQTKSRIDILNVLAEHDKALSPYQIQDLLKEKGKDYSAITIYRILETFMGIDIIHKVHSINSYMKCAHEHDHEHTLLVCKSCHQVEAMEREEQNTKTIKGFKIDQVVDEVVGLCDTCNEED